MDERALDRDHHLGALQEPGISSSARCCSSFSIFFPFLKLFYLLTLMTSPDLPAEFRKKSIATMEWLGRYSMTDVMVLALMIFYVNSSGYTEATRAARRLLLRRQRAASPCWPTAGPTRFPHAADALARRLTRSPPCLPRAVPRHTPHQSRSAPQVGVRELRTVREVGPEPHLILARHAIGSDRRKAGRETGLSLFHLACTGSHPGRRRRI